MRSKSLLVLASLALTACASPRAADLRLPGGYETNTPAPAGAIALDRWWTTYEDPELTTLVEQALERNADVRLAAARLAEARAVRQGVIAQLFPQGDLTGSARRVKSEQLSGTNVNIPGFSQDGTSETTSANFNVSWEVDVFGRTFAANRATKADVSGVRFAYEGVRAAIAAQTADAYFTARGLAIQVADAREAARISRGLLETAQARADHGLVADSEPDRIATEVAQSEAQATALEAELQAQKRAILVLTGRVIEPTANINAPPNVGAAPVVPAALPSDLLLRRPDVRQAEAGVRSAAARQDIAERAFLPTFTFSPGVGWSKQSQPNFESEVLSWTLGGSVLQPILSIPRRLADLKAENARTEQAVTNYEKVVQTAFQETEGALVRLEADRSRVVLLTQGEARARRAYEAGRLGYDRGLTDISTTLQTEQAWRAARAQLTAAQVQALRRSVQAYKALGGGWSAPAK